MDQAYGVRARGSTKVLSRRLSGGMKLDAAIKLVVSPGRSLSCLRNLAKFFLRACKSLERAPRNNRASPLTGREILQEELL